MIYDVSRKEKNIVGKWDIQVGVDDFNTIFLSFHEEPTNEDIKIEVDKYIANQSIIGVG